jgi:hypothetical protein
MSEAMDAAIDRIERLFDGRRYAEVVELCTALLAEFLTEFRFLLGAWCRAVKATTGTS